MTDPVHIERLTAQLAEVIRIHVRAVQRAARPPRIHESEWRGMAYAQYAVMAGDLATDLVIAHEDLADAKAELVGEWNRALV